MAEKKEKAVEVIAETVTESTPVVTEVKVNPEQFLKDFNWHKL